MNSQPSTGISIVSAGAVPNSGIPCTEAIQRVLDECGENGGGTVIVPAGTFYTGPLRLSGGTCLYLEAGSVLRFSNNPADFPVIKDQWEGMDCDVYMPLLYAKNAENITVAGSGTLDGQGAPWWEFYRKKTLKYPRPRTVSFYACKNVRIDGIRIINSPNWTVNPVECENVTLSNLDIGNPADSPTTDGIDPCSCKNVFITGCRIDVGDDCIAIKSGMEECPRRIPCENIIVSHCTMLHGHGGLVIGSEMSGDVRNVTVENCIFQDTDRGIRIKSRRGRGGIVEKIQAANIIMDRVLSPFIINEYYFCGKGGKELRVRDKTSCPVTEATPLIRNIQLSGITATGVRAAACFIYGLPEQPVENIRLDDITVDMDQNCEPCPPDMMDDAEPMKNRGFCLWNIKGARVHNVRLTGLEGDPFLLRQAKNITVSGCSIDLAT